MMGSDFHITSRTGRTVTVEGFGGNDTVIRDMEICTGITCATGVDGSEPILLRVNHGISTTDKSILSCNQMRCHGLIVDDCPRRFGGRQSMWLPDRTFMPLLYKTALCFLPIRKPTEQELATLFVYDITPPDNLWKPSDQNDQMLTFMDDDSAYDPNDPDTIMGNLEGREESKSSRNRSNNKATTQNGLFNMEHLQRCLGWKPTDVIESTLKATTQLAENHIRLPMRMHFKSRSPALNVRRLNETFATDTFFSSEKALGGFTMAQLYVGKTSTFTEIYGMKRKSQMSETL